MRRHEHTLFFSPFLCLHIRCQGITLRPVVIWTPLLLRLVPEALLSSFFKKWNFVLLPSCSLPVVFCHPSLSSCAIACYLFSECSFVSRMIEPFAYLSFVVYLQSSLDHPLPLLLYQHPTFIRRFLPRSNLALRSILTV